MMELFCGEWVKQILERLGMKEDEPIESKMVTRRIQQAQKSIADRCVSDLPADSAGEWLKLNRAIQ